MTLLAETNWTVFVTTVVMPVLTAILGAIWAAARWWANRRDQEAERQRQHEVSIVEKMDRLAQRSETAQQGMFSTLVGVHRKSIQTMVEVKAVVQSNTFAIEKLARSALAALTWRLPASTAGLQCSCVASLKAMAAGRRCSAPTS